MPREVWYKLVVRRQSVDQFSIEVNQLDCGLCAEFHIIEEFALTGRESLSPRTGLLSRSHVSLCTFHPPAYLTYLTYPSAATTTSANYREAPTDGNLSLHDPLHPSPKQTRQNTIIQVLRALRR